MGSTDFFNQPGVTFLRDAWAAAKFGRLRDAQQVRLVSEQDQWPDFEIQLDNSVERFEFVEALRQRKRANEYREAERRLATGESAARQDPVEEWYARAKEALPAVREAAQKKAAKRYPAGAGLLVYLNINEWGVCQTQIEAGFAEAAAPALARFASTWILWKERLYGPFKAGLDAK